LVSKVTKMNIYRSYISVEIKAEHAGELIQKKGKLIAVINALDDTKVTDEGFFILAGEQE